MGAQVRPRTQRSKKGGGEPREWKRQSVWSRLPKAILPSRPDFAAQPPGELEQVTS